MEELHVVATYNLIRNAAILAEEGLGYVLGFDKLINTDGNNKLCFRPLLPKLETNMHLAWKKNQILTKQAEVFLKALQEDLSSKNI